MRRVIDMERTFRAEIRGRKSKNRESKSALKNTRYEINIPKLMNKAKAYPHIIPMAGDGLACAGIYKPIAPGIGCLRAHYVFARF